MMMTPSWPDAVAGEKKTKETSDNSCHLSHQDHGHGVWSIFYCGGSNAIKKDLKEISYRYGIDLAMENFD
jgi:hypothetical protein